MQKKNPTIFFFLANYHSCSEVGQQATFTSRLLSNVFPSPQQQLNRARVQQCSNISEGSDAPPGLMTSRWSDIILQLCVNSRQPIPNTHSAALFYLFFFFNDLLSEAAPLESGIKIRSDSARTYKLFSCLKYVWILLLKFVQLQRIHQSLIWSFI